MSAERISLSSLEGLGEESDYMIAHEAPLTCSKQKAGKSAVIATNKGIK